MIVLYQDEHVVILDNYEWTGSPDGIYLKTHHYSWMLSPIGTLYRVLLNRVDRSLIYISNEYYHERYLAIETQLVGDVLILGMGFALIDSYLITGSSWVWVERSQLIIDNVTPVNGSVAQGDAEDENFLATLGTFDTILIDFSRSNDKIIDYTQYLNLGGNVIEMKL